MDTDGRLARLPRGVWAEERVLRRLQRRKDREPALRERYYRLKAALVRRRTQLALHNARAPDPQPGSIATPQSAPPPATEPGPVPRT